MHRHALTDEQWRRLQAVLPKQKAGPEATRGDRVFIEAVLFRAKTGLPWLPERFGPWNGLQPILELGEEGTLGNDLQGAADRGR